MTDSKRKIVLAYSGGLDTSTVLKWLQEEYDADIIAFCADIGQMEDLDLVRENAEKIGASKIYIKDLKEEFVTQYGFKTMRAGALYEGKYPLSSSMSRPLIVKEMVAIAERENAFALAHGASGKGNDQVRFHSSMVSLNPDLELLTPVIDWPMNSRDQQIDYARDRGIEIPVTKEAAYSLDKNLWGCSISCGPVEDLSFATHEEMYELTRSLEDAPDQPQIVEIYFEKGIPCKINGKEYGPIELMVELNRLAGENGIGRIDMVENRVVGIKSREVYECPGSIALHVAHSELESLTIDHETLKFKKMISPRYSELVYCGHWFSPLKIAFDAFIDSTQENVTGSIKMKFYKGNCTVIGRESKYSLYDYELSTYSLGDRFDHHAGKGFTQIFGLQLKTMSEVRKKVSG